MPEINAEELKPLLTDGKEIAFLDIREHGQYGEGHPFFCVNLPYSRLELLAPRLMPSRSVRCVLMDDGDGVSVRAAAALERIGYTNVSIMQGGAPAWAAAGFTLFKGVNVPSKTFGELVEHHFDTPSMAAEDLNELIHDGTDLILLDGRTGDEFRKMSLPTAISCPNAEIGYRLPMLCSDPTVPVIVNCAGRTRSIIGAQSLSLLNTPNPVYALRNGTQGWRLAGFDLVHNADPLPLPKPDGSHLEFGRAQAEDLRARYGIEQITVVEAKTWIADTTRSTFLFDVRDVDEFARGHVPGARPAPGGQLVQATDEQLAVRNARIVLCCDNGLRSAITAIWLKGMGHQVWILETDAPRTELGMDEKPGLAATATINTDRLKERIDGGAEVWDASQGIVYRDGHIDGARWVTRARLETKAVSDITKLVIVGQDAELVQGILREFEATIGEAPRDVHVGTPAEWRSAGLEIVASPNSPPETECIDYLFFVHDRHDGNLDAARRYLEWETGLLDQLDAQERGALSPL